MMVNGETGELGALVVLPVKKETKQGQGHVTTLTPQTKVTPVWGTVVKQKPVMKGHVLVGIECTTTTLREKKKTLWE